MLAIVAKNQEPTNMIDRRPPKNPVNEQMFDRQFELLTGFSPLSWQSRLFSEYFERGELPAGVDVPTGLGRTVVMAPWLIARGRRANRTLAEALACALGRDHVVDEAAMLAEAGEDPVLSPIGGSASGQTRFRLAQRTVANAISDRGFHFSRLLACLGSKNVARLPTLSGAGKPRFGFIEDWHALVLENCAEKYFWGGPRPGLFESGVFRVRANWTRFSKRHLSAAKTQHIALVGRGSSID